MTNIYINYIKRREEDDLETLSKKNDHHQQLSDQKGETKLKELKTTMVHSSISSLVSLSSYKY